MLKTVLAESLCLTMLFVLAYAFLVLAPALDQNLIELYDKPQ